MTECLPMVREPEEVIIPELLDIVRISPGIDDRPANFHENGLRRLGHLFSIRRFTPVAHRARASQAETGNSIGRREGESACRRSVVVIMPGQDIAGTQGRC